MLADSNAAPPRAAPVRLDGAPRFAVAASVPPAAPAPLQGPQVGEVLRTGTRRAVRLLGPVIDERLDPGLGAFGLCLEHPLPLEVGGTIARLNKAAPPATYA